MEGIIVAAGKGKRLNKGCKALVKVSGKYLIEYPLSNMGELGIKKVFIIENEKDISSVLGNEWNGLELEYVTQKEKKGIAHAISLLKPYVSESVCIILGDIIYHGSLLAMKQAFESENVDLLVAMKSVKDKSVITKSYGLLGIRFIEKPKNIYKLRPLLGLGIYMAKRRELFNAINRTKQDESGEIQITNSLNEFDVKDHFILDGFYMNVNTEEELNEAKSNKRK